jgi:hypothetical protein
MKNKIKCQNCFKTEEAVEEIEINGEKKLFCDTCADGWRIEQNEK